MKTFTRADLLALASHSTTMCDPSTEKGHWKSTGGFTPSLVLSPEVKAFLAAANSHGFVTPAVNWTEWIRTDRGKLLVTDRSAIAGASADELAHILTSLVRGERFNTGTVLSAAQSGLLGAVAMRASVLAATAPG